MQYRAEITMQEHIATRRDNIGNLVINAFILVGILLVFCIVGGLAWAVFGHVARRGKDNPDASHDQLHLNEHFNDKAPFCASWTEILRLEVEHFPASGPALCENGHSRK